MKIFREMVRNTQMGIQSIDNLMGYIEDDRLKNAVLTQKEILDDFYVRSLSELGEDEKQQAKTGKMEQTMLKAGVHMNAMFNRDSTHIASMLIDGYNMGITSIQKCINELREDGSDAPLIAKDLMKTYDKNIKTLRTFL